MAWHATISKSAIIRPEGLECEGGWQSGRGRSTREPAQPVAGPDVRAVHQESDPAVRADLAHRRRLHTGDGLALFAGAVCVPQSRPGYAQRGRRTGHRPVNEITTASGAECRRRATETALSEVAVREPGGHTRGR